MVKLFLMKNIVKRIIYKLARRKFVRGVDKFCINKKGRALLYFKTEGFFLRGFLQDFSHVNNWESFEIARILNTLGFVVDIIDRTATKDDIKKYIKDDYDLFIGLGAGDSGRYFAEIGEKTKKAVRVLYAMGPEPDLSNRITKARHDYFRSRHPDIPVQDRRLITAVDTKRLYSATDAIITIGNEFSYGSYLHLGKDVYKIYLSTQPDLSMDEMEFQKKNPKKFMYFGGNGNIVKGLDLVLEVFMERPDLELYIGASQNEEDFNVYAKPIFEKTKNIHNLGFVDVAGKEFRDVTSVCGYIIFPSASEGCATSVTTCMRRGLVPILTIESGVDMGDFGYLILKGDIESVGKMVDVASRSSRDELIKRAQATYKESEKYTQKNFTKSFGEAVREILRKRDYLV